jgi:hypothetical protein
VDRETPGLDNTPANREWRVFKEEEAPGEVLKGTEKDETSNGISASIAPTTVPSRPSLSPLLPRRSFAPSIDPLIPSTSPPSHLLYSEPRELLPVLDSIMTSRDATPSPPRSLLPELAMCPFELSFDDIPYLQEAMSDTPCLCPVPLNKAKETQVETKVKETDVNDDEVSSEAGRLFYAD